MSFLKAFSSQGVRFDSTVTISVCQLAGAEEHRQGSLLESIKVPEKSKRRMQSGQWEKDVLLNGVC